MLRDFKQHWHQFIQVPPGERFKAHFERRQQSRPSAFHQKLLAIGGGLLIMGVGLIMLIAPGPGVLALFAGAALIAQESVTAARMLDWIDLRLLQPLIAWGEGAWRRHRNR